VIAIPIPAFAPLLSPPFVAAVTGTDWPETVDDEEEVVEAPALATEVTVTVPTVEGTSVVVEELELLEDVNVLVDDKLAKFHPLICTPWMTDPVPKMVIVVGIHDPSTELMGVMTWPLVKVERHSFASGAAKIPFRKLKPLTCCQNQDRNPRS
jgi:hypothetical protein